MRLRRLAAVLVTTGTVLLGLAGPAAALPPITTPVQPAPCYVNPGLCFYYEGNSTFTVWSLYDTTNTSNYYTIWNVSTHHQLAVCGDGISCTAHADPVDMPTRRCYAYAAYLGGKTFSTPPTPTIRTANLIQVCG